MSRRADYKHSLGLVAIATGAVAAFIGASAAVAAVNTNAPGWFVCTAVCGLLGLLLVRRGLKMRNAAVAEGSTLIEHMAGSDEGTGRTTRTEARKPSFLKQCEDSDEDTE